jgi:hypothetical protein
VTHLLVEGATEPTGQLAVPTPDERPTLPLWPDVARILSLGRSGVYAAAARGEIPTLKFGRRVAVPTAALRRMLGMDP